MSENEHRESASSREKKVSTLLADLEKLRSLQEKMLDRRQLLKPLAAEARQKVEEIKKQLEDPVISTAIEALVRSHETQVPLVSREGNSLVDVAAGLRRAFEQVNVQQGELNG